MFRSNVNIKHANKSHLYWGIDKSTGDVVYIDDVANSGLNCNCKCAACQGDFIARKGEKNIHHFAHQSNYDCVYANEIAVYLFARKVLAHCKEIEVPLVKVKMGQQILTAKKKETVPVGQVYYQCDPEQYPPLLIVELGGIHTRIVLSFENYYTAADYALLEDEAREKRWYCLSIKLPRISNEQQINKKLVESSVQLAANSKEWIRNGMRDETEKRIRERARTPDIIKGRTQNAYACPIHEREYNGLFYAFSSDCDNCNYNCTPDSECSCLAIDGYLNLDDLDSPTEKRMRRLANIQKGKDQIRKIKEQNFKKSMDYKTNDVYQWSWKESVPKQILSASEKYRIGLEEVRDKMNVPSSSPVWDQFNVRWAKCKICQVVKPTSEMAVYGGPNEANFGECSECVRKRSMRKR